MIELETAVFLQNQKTGSTFVEHFLRANASEKIIAHQQHKAPVILRRGKFHFTAVRNPFDLYLSLFNYGLDGGGRIRAQLDRMDKGHFYQAGLDRFDDWLNFVLSAEFKPVLPRYQPHCDAMGLCTWRYQQMATMNFRFETSKLDNVMRFETLNDDLKALTRGPLAQCMNDVDSACRWIDERTQINASNRRDRKREINLTRDTLKLLLRREKPLFDEFYPREGKAIAAATRWPRFGKPITSAELL